MDEAGLRSVDTIRRLVGVYDADGTAWGEISYWIGARMGRTHCSLCEITHGTFRVRREWTACRDTLPVPFDTFHRDDQPDDVRAATGGAAPVVVAVTDAGIVTLLDPMALEACTGEADRLLAAVEGAVATDPRLRWP